MTQIICTLCILLNTSLKLVEAKPRSVICRSVWLFWVMPALVLHWLYGSELRSYFTSLTPLDLITDFESLTAAILNGQLLLSYYDGGYLSTFMRDVFQPDVYSKLTTCPQYLECFMSLVSNVTQRLGWFDNSVVVKLTGLRYGLRALPVSFGSKGLINAGTEFYTMEDSDKVGSQVEGYAFSRHSRRVAKRFQPWLVRFTENGHLAWWHSVSELQLRHHFRFNASDTLTTHRSEFNIIDAKLTVTDFCGSYVAYVACLGLVLISFLLEKFNH